MPIDVPRRAVSDPRPLLQSGLPVVSPVLVAVVEDGAISLTSADGDLTVQVPFDEPVGSGGGVATATAVSVVCALDTALTRRLYRRVGAWHTDAAGRLTTRVRASS